MPINISTSLSKPSIYIYLSIHIFSLQAIYLYLSIYPHLSMPSIYIYLSLSRRHLSSFSLSMLSVYIYLCIYIFSLHVVYLHLSIIFFLSLFQTYAADIFFAQSWKDWRLRLPDNMTHEYRLLPVAWLKVRVWSLITGGSFLSPLLLPLSLLFFLLLWGLITGEISRLFRFFHYCCSFPLPFTCGLDESMCGSSRWTLSFAYTIFFISVVFSPLSSRLRVFATVSRKRFLHKSLERFCYLVL